MAAVTCPHCSHVFDPPTRRKASAHSPDPIDLSSLSDRELFAYCKRTAPAADIAFVRAVKPELSATIDAIVAGPGTDRDKARRVFTAFREFGSRPANETAFWREAVYRRKRTAGRAYRQQCADLRSHIARAAAQARSYGYTYSEIPSTAYDVTIELVRAARTLCGPVPALNGAAVYESPAQAAA